MSDRYLNDFFDAYVTCALWSSNDEGGKPLDASFGREDIAPSALIRMRDDCHGFIVRASMKIRRNWNADSAGHDFWLTRNGHGAGFWARGEPDGPLLTKYAEEYGPCDLYVGNDGSIYL